MIVTLLILSHTQIYYSLSYSCKVTRHLPAAQRRARPRSLTAVALPFSFHGGGERPLAGDAAQHGPRRHGSRPRRSRRCAAGAQARARSPHAANNIIPTLLIPGRTALATALALPSPRPSLTHTQTRHTSITSRYPAPRFVTNSAIAQIRRRAARTARAPRCPTTNHRT